MNRIDSFSGGSDGGGADFEPPVPAEQIEGQADVAQELLALNTWAMQRDDPFAPIEITDDSRFDVLRRLGYQTGKQIHHIDLKQLAINRLPQE